MIMKESTIREQMLEPAKELLAALENGIRVDVHIEELSRLLEVAKSTGLD